MSVGNIFILIGMFFLIFWSAHQSEHFVGFPDRHDWPGRSCRSRIFLSWPGFSSWFFDHHTKMNALLVFLTSMTGLISHEYFYPNRGVLFCFSITTLKWTLCWFSWQHDWPGRSCRSGIFLSWLRCSFWFFDHHSKVNTLLVFLIGMYFYPDRGVLLGFLIATPKWTLCWFSWPAWLAWPVMPVRNIFIMTGVFFLIFRSPHQSEHFAGFPSSQEYFYSNRSVLLGFSITKPKQRQVQLLVFLIGLTGPDQVSLENQQVHLHWSGRLEN